MTGKDSFPHGAPQLLPPKLKTNALNCNRLNFNYNIQSDHKGRTPGRQQKPLDITEKISNHYPEANGALSDIPKALKRGKKPLRFQNILTQYDGILKQQIRHVFCIYGQHHFHGY
jgi:hypothetical protein